MNRNPRDFIPPPTREDLVKQYGEPDQWATHPASCDNDARVTIGGNALQLWCDYMRREYGDRYGDANAISREHIEEIRHSYILESVGDLIAGLYHFSMRYGIDPDRLHEQAMTHFTAEVGLGYEQEGPLQ